ncbi:HNH/ENDO VII family nuclease [Halalkalibacter sp. APA_J-10(15)]|uniref:HNH/ENDO VII family nuclease n=1 Tax=Halalkalibacter sp. APA_J-10(15) TaxID=2933805 RepID=UPI001FF6C5EA|nr:HNH/ENDO VII family nuclease [Halalkalibacter sp. APA_J-10(15)]
MIVYQRDDIINPNMKDARGGTNLERMQKGLAPLGPDGKSINLHHTTQRNESSIAEVTQTFHKDNSCVIHINPNPIPSGINRSEFNKWRIDYWKNRANDF